MSLVANKEVVRRFLLEALAGGDLLAADALLADSVRSENALIYHQPGSGKEGISEAIRLLHVGFPDLTIRVEEMMAEDDRVMARLTIAGTNTGPYRGLPEPTGKSGDMRAIFVFRLVGGRIAEIRGVADRMHFLTQLGILPDIG